jgi:ornithine cyclodeaminase
MSGVKVTRASSASDACRGADIVTTVTADKRNAIILTPPMVQRGVHLNAVGGDCPGKTELHPDILRRSGTRVVVEYEPQSRIEGEIQQLENDFPVVEFADVVRGRTPGRGGRDEVTIFDSVGFALEDYSALRFLHSLLLEERSGRRQIDLVPDLEDPKDLYGGTLGQGRRRARLRAAG